MVNTSDGKTTKSYITWECHAHGILHPEEMLQIQAPRHAAQFYPAAVEVSVDPCLHKLLILLLVINVFVLVIEAALRLPGHQIFSLLLIYDIVIVVSVVTIDIIVSY